MRSKKVRTSAIIGQRHDRRDHGTIAHKAAKTGFHPMNGNQNTGWHAILPFQRVVKGGVIHASFAALCHNGRTATHLQELLKTVLETLLVAIGRDGTAGIL